MIQVGIRANIISKNIHRRSGAYNAAETQYQCHKEHQAAFVNRQFHNTFLSAYQVSMLSCPVLSFVWYGSGFIRAYAPLPFCPKADVVSL